MRDRPVDVLRRQTRPPSARAVRDAWLEGEITRVFKASGERSGARKVWWQLHREHVAAGRCTVERLMFRLGLRGVRRGGYKVVTTVADASQDPPGDLVDRDFGAAAPNRLWVVDFTYVGTGAGTVYTALVIDAFSRMIVGWRTAGHHRMTLVLDALVMAVAARRREGVSVAGAIHHSDAGSEYLAIRYGRELTAAGMTPSVGSVGDSYDNALAESVIGLYKSEVIAHQGPWRDLAQVEAATTTWQAGSTSSGCSGRSAGTRRPSTSRPSTPASWTRPSAHRAARKPARPPGRPRRPRKGGGMAATGLFRRAPPAPAGALPQTPALLRDGTTPGTVAGGTEGRHLLAGWSSMPPNPRPGQGRLRRRTRGAQWHPLAPSGEPAAPPAAARRRDANPPSGQPARQQPPEGRTRTHAVNRCSERTKNEQKDHLLAGQGAAELR